MYFPISGKQRSHSLPYKICYKPSVVVHNIGFIDSTWEKETERSETQCCRQSQKETEGHPLLCKPPFLNKHVATIKQEDSPRSISHGNIHAIKPQM